MRKLITKAVKYYEFAGSAGAGYQRVCKVLECFVKLFCNSCPIKLNKKHDIVESLHLDNATKVKPVEKPSLPNHT